MIRNEQVTRSWQHFDSPLWRAILASICILIAPAAFADWHIGKIVQMGIAYDGSTIVFKVAGWSRSNCTCYASWPDTMCLDRTRASFKEEYASILRARATGQQIWANIDETTCKVGALYEVD